MKRALVNVAAAMSALLCLATIAAWVHTYWALDYFEWRSGSRTAAVAWSHGQFAVYLDERRQAPGVSAYVTPPRVESLGMPQRAVWEWGGFALQRRPERGWWAFIMPAWMLPVLFGTLPVFWFVRARRARRRRLRAAAKCCIACGYDLRASPERCPECGASRSDDWC